MRVHWVVPDDELPSGGNVYDRRAATGLAELGFEVRVSAVAGAWPQPDRAALDRLGHALGGIADGEVVLFDGIVACGVPDVIAAHARRLRVAILVHLPLADETGLSARTAALLDAAEQRALSAAELVITTSPQTARRLPGARIAIPGTDPAPVATGTDGVSRLLCVAALMPRKGQELLLRALDDMPLTCEFVGPERDSGYARVLRERGGVLRGPLTGAELDEVYASADLLVQPSLAETYGMAVTEGLARGIPVIASAVPDALGDGGLLLPPGDLDALTAALRDWVADPAFRERLRAAALRRRAELPTWDATARQLAAALTSLEA
ncbi:glycosyltransferase family 4 protein [Saccharopolyspora flava]|uniref:Glycosyltransferase involved in cell wall bisynthesis n=1 Tax=Saccharopolyspora flava TaxID=95161 RepID=A0A1I6S9J6_9PSEU|nr:glycosyltransferase family 4 protein [Saccharopolyspora flava]SFS73560.1 Glycosyltransferase involved in cell wall bisynthesis [Saccharopolyspora flava]